MSTAVLAAEVADKQSGEPFFFWLLRRTRRTAGGWS